MAKTNRYIERINRVLNYIEEHLDSDFTLENLAAVSHFSPFHFHRLFKSMVGESVASYIRRLKLERAAQRLLVIKDNITTIALESGFETPSSFAKAFKSHFSLTPTEFIESKAEVMRKRFNPQLLSEEAMIEHTLENLEPFKVNFIRKTGDYFKTAPEAWNAIRQLVKDKNLDKTQFKFYGLAHDNPDITDVNKCRFDACLKGDSLMPSEGQLQQQTLGSGLYAVFSHTGAYDTLGETFRKIFGPWITHQENYELRDALSFCHYVDREVIDYPSMSDEQRSKLTTKIYVPIKKL